MARKLELQDLMNEIGINNLNDLMKGCGQIAMLINELPPTERMRLHARLNEVLITEQTPLPFAGRFLVEVVSKGLTQPSPLHSECDDVLGKDLN